jgi:hypothetical protein
MLHVSSRTDFILLLLKYVVVKSENVSWIQLSQVSDQWRGL